jgi:hypothetical protein
MAVRFQQRNAGTMTSTGKRIAAAAMVAALTAVTFATAADAGDIAVVDAWARASAGPARAAAAFLKVENKGATADRLLAASATIADRVELHTHIQSGDVMQMRPVENIDVAPNGLTELKPGGLHVMFLGLRAPLVEGTSFPLTLTFEKAGATTVEVRVVAAGAMGPGAGNGHPPHRHGAQ